jgi:hypothetical protein
LLKSTYVALPLFLSTLVSSYTTWGFSALANILAEAQSCLSVFHIRLMISPSTLMFTLY